MKARVAYLVEVGVIESKTVVGGKYDGRQQKIRSHATSCWERRNSKLLKKDMRGVSLFAGVRSRSRVQYVRSVRAMPTKSKANGQEKREGTNVGI